VNEMAMATKPHSENLTLEGAAGKLEALLDKPRELAVRGTVVVCHPHPLHGGNLQNKVAHTLARAFGTSGFQALRFNFRGVGESEGHFDDGIGELDDVLAALRWVDLHAPSQPVWLAGFSFGAAMAVRAAVHTTPAGLVSIAPATSRFADNLDGQPNCPWLIVQGDQDELVPIQETIDWLNTLEPGPHLEVFADTEHFFHGKLVSLRKSVEAFVQEHDQ